MALVKATPEEMKEHRRCAAAEHIHGASALDRHLGINLIDRYPDLVAQIAPEPEPGTRHAADLAELCEMMRVRRGESSHWLLRANNLKHMFRSSSDTLQRAKMIVSTADPEFVEWLREQKPEVYLPSSLGVPFGEEV